MSPSNLHVNTLTPDVNLFLEIGSLGVKVKRGQKGGALIWSDQCPCKKRKRNQSTFSISVFFLPPLPNPKHIY